MQLKTKNGITLIALVVTIIVLLILAGVSINAVFSDSGIIKKAQDAQNKMDEAIKSDMDAMNTLANLLDSYMNSGTTPKVTIGEEEVTLTKENIGQYLGKVVSNYKSGATEQTESITIGQTLGSPSYTVSTKYRLYYVDFDNKYGDGAGTIYLKADCISSDYAYELKFQSNTEAFEVGTSPVDAEKVKIKQLNPALYANGVTTSPPSDENANIKAVTWLTNTSNWAGLKDTSATISSKINYVVGAPSLEMMIDSYNTHYGLTGTTPDTSTLSASSNRVKLFYQYPPCIENTTASESRGLIQLENYDSGYAVGPSNDTSANNGYFYSTSENTIKTGDNIYYPGDNQCYWLASPSAATISSVMKVTDTCISYAGGSTIRDTDMAEEMMVLGLDTSRSSNDASGLEGSGGLIQGNDSVDGRCGLCPVVSLKPDVKLELVNDSQLELLQ